MPRLLEVADLCSRTVSGTAYRFRHGSTLCSPTVEKILCRTPFRSGHMSALCARLTTKGKVGVQRGRKTAGCPSFLPTAVGTASSPRSAERSSPLRFSKKLPARQGRTRLRQFACPGQPVQKRSRPDRANPPAAVRVPWSPCAEKRKAPQNCFHGAQSMHFYSNRSSVSTSLRAGACGSCAG